MDNKEEILEALEDFGRKPPEKIGALLEQYLEHVARTGETWFVWSKLKPLFLRKLDDTMQEFFETVPTDDLAPCPNVENVKFEEMRQRLLTAVTNFTGAPFTIQRLCELVTNPRKHYKRTDKFLRGIEKNLLVVSTVDPFGNKIVSESKSLVNGLDSNGFENKASPDTTQLSPFLSPLAPSNTSASASPVTSMPGWFNTGPSVGESSVFSSWGSSAAGMGPLADSSDPESPGLGEGSSGSGSEGDSSSDSSSSRDSLPGDDRMQEAERNLERESEEDGLPMDTEGDKEPGSVEEDSSGQNEAVAAVAELSRPCADSREDEPVCTRPCADSCEDEPVCTRPCADSCEDEPVGTRPCADSHDDEPVCKRLRGVCEEGRGVCEEGQGDTQPGSTGEAEAKGEQSINEESHKVAESSSSHCVEAQSTIPTPDGLEREDSQGFDTPVTSDKDSEAEDASSQVSSFSEEVQQSESVGSSQDVPTDDQPDSRLDAAGGDSEVVCGSEESVDSREQTMAENVTDSLSSSQSLSDDSQCSWGTTPSGESEHPSQSGDQSAQSEDSSASLSSWPSARDQSEQVSSSSSSVDPGQTTPHPPGSDTEASEAQSMPRSPTGSDSGPEGAGPVMDPTPEPTQSADSDSSCQQSDIVSAPTSQTDHQVAAHTSPTQTSSEAPDEGLSDDQTPKELDPSGPRTEEPMDTE